MIKLFLPAIAVLALLPSCAGNSSEQVPTINGNNNTMATDKTSRTSVDAAGSGYGDVK